MLTIKLYIKEKAFSLNDKFAVWDDQGKDKYTVQGEILSFGKKLHVYNCREEEVALIKQNIFSFTPQFNIFVNGQQIATVRKLSINYTKQNYVINDLDWNVKGNYWFHNYRVVKNENNIATIAKTPTIWGDCYEIDVVDSANEIAVLAIALIIDCVQDANNR